MADTINTINGNAGIFVRAIAEKLEDQCVFFKSVKKVDPSDYEGKNGFSAGNKLNISIPPVKLPQDGFDISSADYDVAERSKSIVLDIEKTIPFDLTSNQLATDLSTEGAMRRWVPGLASSMAQAIEEVYLQKATQATANLVGTPGSTGYTVSEVLAARTKMNKFLCPKDDRRHLLFESEAGAAAVDARKGQFQSSDQIKKQYETGLMGVSDGFMWHETELGYVHTNGSMGGTPLVDGAVSTEGTTTIHIDGVTSGNTWTKGTVFTIAGVYAVHPVTKKTYNFLKQFVVAANVTFTGGEADVTVTEEIYTSASGGLQTVSAFPADNAAITTVGAASTSYSQQLAFHEEAFRAVSVPLEMPRNAEFQAQYTTNAGITLALVRDFDVTLRRWVTRLDFLGGFTDVYANHACRITA